MTRQRQNLIIALAAFLVVAIAALEIGTEVRAGRPGDAPRRLHGDVARFHLTADVDAAAPTADQREAIERGLSAMQDWLGRHGGAVITRSTPVVLTDHEHCDHGTADPETTGVTIDGRRICVFTADEPTMREEFVAAQTAAHEAVHVLQSQLGCSPVLPRWLVEGMAEDLSWRATQPDLDEAKLRNWAGTLETDAGAGSHLNYGTAMRAVLEVEGGHPGRLVAFCRAVGEGAPWAMAFGQTFDASPARFDARF